MTFVPIELSEIAVGKEIKRDFALKVKNNLDDLDTRAGQTNGNVASNYTDLSKKISDLEEAMKTVPPVIDIVAAEIDWSLGNIYSKTITGKTDFTFIKVPDGKTIVVHLRNDTGASLAITWPNNVRGGRASVPAGKVVIVTLLAIKNAVFSTGVEF